MRERLPRYVVVEVVPAGARAWEGLLQFLMRPRLLQFNLAMVLLGLLLAAFLVPDGLLRLQARADLAPLALPSFASGGDRVHVRFVLYAPEAQSVAVAGDFNQWNPQTILLEDERGDGLWTVTVPLSRGRHQYMFVVDGTKWVSDPMAEAYQEDGFGRKNALLAL